MNVTKMLSLRHCQRKSLFSSFSFRTSLKQFKNINDYSTTCGKTLKSKPVCIDEKNAGDVFEQYDTVLLDCDGVLWKTDQVGKIPNIGLSIKTLQDLNKKVLFVSNNSVRTVPMYKERMKNMCEYFPEKAQLLGVPYVTSVYLQKIAQMKKKVYVIGMSGIGEELDSLGISHFGIGPDTDQVSYDSNSIRQLELEKNVGAVLVAFDPLFNYSKIAKACSYLSDPECLFIATNILECGHMISPKHFKPSTGVLVKAISAGAKREPIVIGKPNTYFFDLVQTLHPDIDPKRTVMVGDKLDTDVQFALNVGIDSILVLTGSDNIQNIYTKNIYPKYFLNSFGDLYEHLIC